ncbi:MAG: GMC family oxidoreductase [Bacteroidetes bacterium]|nr:GMC family oxidoreductase [Bacteroidota bacterium]
MNQYDIIIIGTGAGGGTLAHALSNSGKKILILERGTYLPREKENWDSIEVFHHDRYHTKEVWKTNDEKDFHPQTGYWVGGNTKVYGAALFRLRERNFESVAHYDGVTPEWPLKYTDFEPYYTEAEKLYNVHGLMGEDPTEPFRSSEFPNPPISHEPRIQEIHDELKKNGYHPFRLPIGVRMNEQDMLNSACIRCDTCDGFPCLIHAKADSDINCVRPSLISDSNITLMTEMKATKLITDASGKTIISVEAERGDEKFSFTADIFVVAAGAINSAVLLLKSANDKHPQGLANSSGMLGRNLMKHHNAAMLAISTKLNPTKFQKTLAVNDFYWGDDNFKFPMGHVQLMGKSNKDQLSPDAPFFTPGLVLDEMANHSVDWWFTSEDLPLAENRVTIKNDQIYLQYNETNMQGFNRLKDKWADILKQVDNVSHLVPHSMYLKKNIPTEGLAHQCGTCRFGNDPKTSVLDINCKTHDTDNLYVVDGSFFPSSGAVNPSLTIIANALRVGEHLKARMK